ncbi:hypothetical protein NX868_10825 [Burkholderia thailandensis]|uniref:hypothetical protein n=1 Tax=Burkholderia thailandensis TaxID=57975 RepID=UPI00217E6F53|nr:hypothetical protein [Burkholderia thailandensis]MCS6454757.1 hypothetical protein [Burkholderia thailandensis]MCS6482770.1 hypothetical protein [Burkholderia thailandensis]MCS6489793.1 hypothetical protein [Burkholderia thailandensis]WNO23841.1 hypothetical protein PhiBTCVTUL1a_32 [Burkholderia phage phiBtTUL1a]
MNDQQQSRTDALTDDQRQALGEAISEHFGKLDSDEGIRTPDGRILRAFDYCDSRTIDDLIDCAIVPALAASPVEQPAGAPIEANEVPAEFVEWFACNYPRDTIIHDPRWHAPKVFRAAASAMKRATAAARSDELAAQAIAIGFRTRAPGFAWVPWLTDDQEAIRRTIADALAHGHEGEAIYSAPRPPAQAAQQVPSAGTLTVGEQQLISRAADSLEYHGQPTVAGELRRLLAFRLAEQADIEQGEPFTLASMLEWGGAPDACRKDPEPRAEVTYADQQVRQRA